MNKLEFSDQILEEMTAVLNRVSDCQVEALKRILLDGNRIYIAGAGRSGLSAKAFAMRLMHMGMEAFVIGEITTPKFTGEDVLLICSGSGETKSLLLMAKKAKVVGGRVVLMTIGEGSSIGRQADAEVYIHAPSPKLEESGTFSIQPMASLFEQCLLLILDIIILKLMKETGATEEEMYSRHANLE